MQRVMIIGQPGSGKSTLARELGARIDLPVVHIDRIHWKSGWVERDQDEKTRLCREVHAREAWIFEGGHSTTWPERLSRADTLVWLDFPLPLRMWRVFRRSLGHYGQSRPDLPKGCPEQFDPEFFRYIWRSRKTGRDNCARLFEQALPRHSVHRLQSNEEVAAFLLSV